MAYTESLAAESVVASKHSKNELPPGVAGLKSFEDLLQLVSRLPQQQKHLFASALNGNPETIPVSSTASTEEHPMDFEDERPLLDPYGEFEAEDDTNLFHFGADTIGPNGFSLLPGFQNGALGPNGYPLLPGTQRDANGDKILPSVAQAQAPQGLQPSGFSQNQPPAQASTGGQPSSSFPSPLAQAPQGLAQADLVGDPPGIAQQIPPKASPRSYGPAGRAGTDHGHANSPYQVQPLSTLDKDQIAAKCGHYNHIVEEALKKAGGGLCP